MAIEPLLRAASNGGAGYELFGHRVTALAYADDIVIAASTSAGMRDLLGRVEEEAGKLGLRFNPRKCATMHTKGARGVIPTEYSLYSTPLTTLGIGDAYQHLGIPTGVRVDQTPYVTIEEMRRDLRLVSGSLLAPWQKAEAVATFILPRLEFLLRGAGVSKGVLTELDKEVRRHAKAWMNLPQRASAEVVYIPPSRGGCGLFPLADLADALTVVHAFRMLSAKDTVVAQIARSSLERAVRKKIHRAPTENDLAEYLSGRMSGEFGSDSGDTASLWSRARAATRRSVAKAGTRWRKDGAAPGLVLECRGSAGRTVLIPPSASAQVVRRLRTAVVEHYLGTLQAKRDQGKVFEVTAQHRVSNHFMRAGAFTRFADWRFIHRARLDVLPLNGARRWADGDRRCRRCGYDIESLPHVLCHCGTHAAARQLRHDAIVRRLAKAIRLPGLVNINQRVRGIDGEMAAMRPDIVVRCESSRTVTIIDVTVPFENRRDGFDLARWEKRAKYAPLAEALAQQGYNVAVDAFLVGSLGAWDPGNESVLRFLGVTKRYAMLMRRLVVSETMAWSRNIYVEHVTGVPQRVVPQALPADPEAEGSA